MRTGRTRQNGFAQSKGDANALPFTAGVAVRRARGARPTATGGTPVAPVADAEARHPKSEMPATPMLATGKMPVDPVGRDKCGRSRETRQECHFPEWRSPSSSRLGAGDSEERQVVVRQGDEREVREGQVNG